MLNFKYYTPTEIIFGTNKTKQVATLINKYKGKKVLIVIGQNYVIESGLLSIVTNSLTDANIEYEILKGVQPNPLLSKVSEGIQLVKDKRLNYILAVGGGSVIDSAKAIAAGVYLKTDVWSIVERRDIKKALPFGVILTIPGAGSEMSPNAVITNDNNNLKRSFSGPALRANFAILDPTLSYTISEYQTACGIVDIIMHTLERYFTNNETLKMTDDIATKLIQNMFVQAKIVLDNPTDYQARAEIMWSSALSHNGLTGVRSDHGDWSTHELANEISAKYNIAHGQALASIWSSWAKYVYKHNVNRFKQFAIEIMEVKAENKSNELIILEAINKLECFFKDLGLKTNLSSLGIKIDETNIKEMSLKASRNNTKSIGNIKTLSINDMKNIYTIAIT